MSLLVREFIETIRNSFEGSVEVYTRGSCYQFFRILKEVFPEAEAYYNMSHVITKIGDKYYDITGEIEKTNHLPITEYPNSTVSNNKFNIQTFAESYHAEKMKEEKYTLDQISKAFDEGRSIDVLSEEAAAKYKKQYIDSLKPEPPK